MTPDLKMFAVFCNTKSDDLSCEYNTLHEDNALFQRLMPCKMANSLEQSTDKVNYLLLDHYLIFITPSRW